MILEQLRRLVPGDGHGRQRLPGARRAGGNPAPPARTNTDTALPAMWHVPAPRGETAELAVAARLFYRPRPGGEYVGRHRAVPTWVPPARAHVDLAALRRHTVVAA